MVANSLKMLVAQFKIEMSALHCAHQVVSLVTVSFELLGTTTFNDPNLKGGPPDLSLICLLNTTVVLYKIMLLLLIFDYFIVLILRRK